LYALVLFNQLLLELFEVFLPLHGGGLVTTPSHQNVDLPDTDLNKLKLNFSFNNLHNFSNQLAAT